MTSPPTAPPPTTVTTPALTLRGVSRAYGPTSTKGPTSTNDGTEPATTWALRGVDLALYRGEMTAIMGPSGSGKTTLLHLAAGLDQPTDGTVHLGDTQLSGLREHALAELRRERLGFVFQAYNLVPSLTVAENLELPFRLAGRPMDRAWVDEVVARVGMRDRAHHLPSQLSGGQQQRVAIARAIVTRPDLVVADEPTGALDQAAAAAILDLLLEVVREVGQTVVLVTHDPRVAAVADRVVMLRDGVIDHDLRAPTLADLNDRVGRAALVSGVRTGGGAA